MAMRLAFLFAIMFGLLLTDTAQAEMTFASVDVQRALAQSDAARRAREMLKREMADKQDELTNMEARIKTLMQRLEQQRSLMTAEARAELQEEIQTMRREYRRLAEDHQAALDRENAKWTQKITRALQGVIQEIGREGGFTAIFGKGQVIYSSPAIDITDRVLQRLDAQTRDWFNN